MKLDNNLCLKVLLDMCKIKYTDKQLVKLENLLSKLYILRTCSVDLGEISQVSEEIPQNDEEISQNTEDFEIKEETLENFEDREVNDTDKNNEDTRDGSQITETVSRNPVIISLKPTTKRKQLEDSESGNENSPKKSKSMPVFSCTVCGLKCHSQTLLVQHVHMIHNNVKTLQCVGCEKGMQYILIYIHIFFYSDDSNMQYLLNKRDFQKKNMRFGTF